VLGTKTMCSENQQSKLIKAEQEDQEEVGQLNPVLPSPINLEADLREFAHLIPKLEKQ